MACGVGWLPLCAAQSSYCLCFAITCRLWLYLNYKKPTHTYIKLRLRTVIWWPKTHQRVCWNTRSCESNTQNTHSVIPKWSSQCVHHTCWRLAWGKQLLIASNPLHFVWDHLSSLLCFSAAALWKPIGWQLTYGILQSPQPGLRDPATLSSPHLLSISSSFAFGPS